MKKIAVQSEFLLLRIGIFSIIAITVKNFEKVKNFSFFGREWREKT